MWGLYSFGMFFGVDVLASCGSFKRASQNKDAGQGARVGCAKPLTAFSRPLQRTGAFRRYSSKVAVKARPTWRILAIFDLPGFPFRPVRLSRALEWPRFCS